MVISDHFLKKDLVHHPTDSQPIQFVDVSGTNFDNFSSSYFQTQDAKKALKKVFARYASNDIIESIWVVVMLRGVR